MAPEDRGAGAGPVMAGRRIPGTIPGSQQTSGGVWGRSDIVLGEMQIGAKDFDGASVMGPL